MQSLGPHKTKFNMRERKAVASSSAQTLHDSRTMNNMVTLIASSYKCSSMLCARPRQFHENALGFLSTTAQKENYGER
jgi:hypothetical protein